MSTVKVRAFFECLSNEPRYLISTSEHHENISQETKLVCIWPPLILRDRECFTLHAGVDANVTSKHDSIIQVFAILNKDSSESDSSHTIGIVKIKIP